MPTDSYTTTDLPDGVRYQLSNLEHNRFVAIIPAAVGIGLACAGFFGIMGGGSGWGFGTTGQAVITIIRIVGGVPFIGMGLLFVGVGVFGAFGEQEIELRGQRVRGVARIGPFRIGRWVPIDQIKQFTIKRPESRSEGSPSLNKPRLFAVREGRKDAQLAWGVRPTLKEIAADLSRRCGLVLPDKLMSEDEPPVEEEEMIELEEGGGELHEEAVIERSTDVPGTPAAMTFEAPAQPATSKATLTRNADGITIDFPPRGFRGGARGLLIFSMIWTGAVGVILLFITTLAASNKPPPAAAYIFLGVFLLIGVGMLLGAISVAKRRAVIDVVSGAVLVTTQGLRGVKSWQCDPDILTDIRVGPSGTTVNDKPVLELQIHRSSGDHAGFLAWRDDDELRWAAAELRSAAGLTGKAADRAPRRRKPLPRSYADS